MSENLPIDIDILQKEVAEYRKVKPILAKMVDHYHVANLENERLREAIVTLQNRIVELEHDLKREVGR